MISSLLPVHRVTSTPHARLTALSRLLDFVCAFECQRHSRRVTVEQVVAGRIRYAACCDELLDAIDTALRAHDLHARTA
ncbi:MAG TPA: hypothetical protein VLU46_05020 [Thermoanaerobaculia bacterium]|nr:hypothetical protein [Thermoanaerobaculia bacterium]